MDPLGSAGILNSNEFNVPFYYRDNITLFPFTAPTYTLSGGLPSLVMPVAFRADRQSTLYRAHRRQSVFADLEFQHPASVEHFFNVRGGVRRHQRQPAPDGVEYQCGASGSTAPGRGSPTVRRWARSVNIPIAPTPSITACRPRSRGGFARAVFPRSYTWSKSIDDQSNGTDIRRQRPVSAKSEQRRAGPRAVQFRPSAGIRGERGVGNPFGRDQR